MNKLLAFFLALVASASEEIRNENYEDEIQRLIGAEVKANPFKYLDLDEKPDGEMFNRNFKRAITDPKVQKAAGKAQESLKKLASLEALEEAGEIVETKAKSGAKGSVTRNIATLRLVLSDQQINEEQERNWAIGYCLYKLEVPEKVTAEKKEKVAVEA